MADDTTEAVSTGAKRLGATATVCAARATVGMAAMVATVVDGRAAMPKEGNPATGATLSLITSESDTVATSARTNISHTSNWYTTC
jgi:hypothetical protein